MASNFYKKNAKAFLHAFVQCGHVERSAKISGVSKDVHYRWLKRYPGYREAYEKAKIDAADRQLDRAEAELARRGVDGYEDVVLHEGRPVFVWVNAAGEIIPDDAPEDQKIRKVVLKKRKYSDACLIVGLKAMSPKYRDSQRVEFSGEVKHKHRVDDEQIKRILADRDTSDLANNLARRVAMLAGGDGQSSN